MGDGEGREAGEVGEAPLLLTGARQEGRGTGEALSVKGKARAGGATPPLRRETGDDLFRRCAPPSPKGEGW